MENRIDAIYARQSVDRKDRISRSILDFATMMELFQEYNVEFVSSTKKFDTSTPMGRAMLNICIVFAQLERETIQKRVTDAYYSRCQRGFHMSGAAPYGFKLESTILQGIRTKLMIPDPDTANITFQGGRKARNTWLAGKIKCGRCGRALKSMGNRAGTQYLRCTKRADNKSCPGCETLRTREFEQFIYGEMVKKMAQFHTLTGKREMVNPKLTALKVELAHVEDEIEKLLNTLTGASAVLISYANGKIEDLDSNRQRLIKEIAALNAETVSPQKIEFLSFHLENWDNIDFEDRRRVADMILSQVHATGDCISFERKI